MRVPSGDQLNEYGAGAVVTRRVVPPSTEPTYTEALHAKAKCPPSGAIVAGADTRGLASVAAGARAPPLQPLASWWAWCRHSAWRAAQGWLRARRPSATGRPVASRGTS